MSGKGIQEDGAGFHDGTRAAVSGGQGDQVDALLWHGHVDIRDLCIFGMVVAQEGVAISSLSKSSMNDWRLPISGKLFSRCKGGG